MATRAQLADAADMLPAFGARRLSRFRLPFLRPRAARGLVSVPERYRLQLLLLTAQRMPGADPQAVTAAAGQLADRVRSRVPGRLLGGHFEDLDPWFRDHAELIAADADELAALWRR